MADTYTPPGLADDQGTFGAAPAHVPKEKTAFQGCLMGCLIVGLLMLVVTGFGAWYALNNWQSILGSFSGYIFRQAIEQSDLPEAEKAEMMEQLDRITTVMKEQKLTEPQLEALRDQLRKSPLFATIIAGAIEKKYFDGSGLSDEKKEEGRLSLKRCMQGLMNGSIEESGFDEAIAHIGDQNGENGWKLRDKVSDEELRAFLAKLKELADEAEIPEEVEDVDPSDELKKIIDAVLEPTSVEESAQEPELKSAEELEVPTE